MKSNRAFFSNLWRFLRSTPRDANLLAFATIAIWIVKALVLDDIPQYFPKANELGKIVDGFLSAVIAGWVFYLFFALLPEFKQKRQIAHYVLRRVADIIADCRFIVNQIQIASGKPLAFADCTFEQLDDAMAGISYKTQVPSMPELMGKVSWLDLFQHRRQRSLETIEALMGLSRYLDDQLVSLTLSVSENAFFGAARALDGLPAKNMDLSVFAEPLERYLGLCRKLAAWHDEHAYTHASSHSQPPRRNA
jgi:hypothetical protein